MTEPCGVGQQPPGSFCQQTWSANKHALSIANESRWSIQTVQQKTNFLWHHYRGKDLVFENFYYFFFILNKPKVIFLFSWRMLLYSYSSGGIWSLFTEIKNSHDIKILMHGPVFTHNCSFEKARMYLNLLYSNSTAKNYSSKTLSHKKMLI